MEPVEDLNIMLVTAAFSCRLDELTRCLAAGADPNATFHMCVTPLALAAFRGHEPCLSALLAAGGLPNRADEYGKTPLHDAAAGGSTACVQLLLAARAKTSAQMAGPFEGIDGTPLHVAAAHGHVPVMRQLLAANPAAALSSSGNKRTPLQTALRFQQLDAARCLLEEGPQLPLEEVLAALGAASGRMHPLYAPLVARQPLTAEQWELVPTPCLASPALLAALPAVLQRSAEEAGQLVRRLRADQQARLRTAALCLGRAQRQHGLQLPTPIVWRVLVAAAE